MTLNEELAVAERLAADAAIELIYFGWPVESVAAALKRPIGWVQTEIELELVAAARRAGDLH